MVISQETVMNVLSRILHVGLLAGATYIAANPKYAWLIPLLSSVGSVTPLK